MTGCSSASRPSRCSACTTGPSRRRRLRHVQGPGDGRVGRASRSSSPGRLPCRHAASGPRPDRGGRGAGAGLADPGGPRGRPGRQGGALGHEDRRRRRLQRRAGAGRDLGHHPHLPRRHARTADPARWARWWHGIATAHGDDGHGSAIGEATRPRSTPRTRPARRRRGHRDRRRGPCRPRPAAVHGLGGFRLHAAAAARQLHLDGHRRRRRPAGRCTAPITTSTTRPCRWASATGSGWSSGCCRRPHERARGAAPGRRLSARSTPIRPGASRPIPTRARAAVPRRTTTA